MKLIKIAAIGCVLAFSGSTHAMNVATANIPMATPFHPDFRAFIDQRITEVIVVNVVLAGIQLTQQEALDEILSDPRTVLQYEFNNWLEQRRINQAVDYVDTVTRQYNPRIGTCPRLPSSSHTNIKSA